MWVRHLISFFLFSTVKIFALLFYQIKATWINPQDEPLWTHDIRLFVFLNHTSLYEPLFVGALPFHFLWWGTPRFLVPGADKTMMRPLVGTFFKLLAPQMISVSRKRDATWEGFLGLIKGDSLVAILPEGRMMRRNGLDKEGKPMSIRGGVADILDRMDSGKIVFGYSAGLHHVQSPGELFPRLFKTLRIRFEKEDIKEYKNRLLEQGQSHHLKPLVVRDLEERKAKYCTFD